MIITKRKLAHLLGTTFRMIWNIIIIAVIATLILAVAYSVWLRGEYFKTVDELLESENQRLIISEETGEELDELDDTVDRLTEQVRKAYSDVYVETLGYEMFTITAYSANDATQGTTNITSIGFDVTESYMNFFNICAVDPGVIPLGSIVIIVMDDVEQMYLAGDIGYLIKGTDIDILMTKEEALAFESGLYPVKIIKPNNVEE